MSKTIGMKPTKDFIKYVLYSGFIENSLRPISALIVANPERGKSTEVQKWNALGVIELQDATSYGFDRQIQAMSGRDLDDVHHIVIPDLEKIASRNRVVRNELLSKLRILTEEGIQNVSTGRDWLHLDKPFRVGVIMCTTPDDLGDKRSVFRSLSMQSRLFPWTYDFSLQLKLRILDYIDSEEHIIRQKYTFKRKKKVKVVLPKKHSRQLNPYAITLARELENFSRKSPIETADEMRLLGIRCKENLMTFLKSIALYHGRKTVRKKDFEEFTGLYRWMNYKFNEIDNPPPIKLIQLNDKTANKHSNLRKKEL
jgi:hypothetical protein